MGSGVGGGEREEKTPARKHCENEKHPLIIALDLSSENEKPTTQHRRTIVPKAPFTSDKIKINTSVVYIMQAASCLREGEYCRLIRVSVIIVGYVRFRLKLNLEAILESKAILLQKICSGHQNERIALRLCQPKFVKKLDCRFFFSFHAIFLSGL